MEDLINRVVQNVGLDPALAEKAIGMIFAFLKKEGPAEEVGQIFAAMPGAEDLASANAPQSGGLMGGIMGMMGGGGVMALGQQMMGAGIGMGQIQSLSKEVFAYGREQAGEDAMGAIVGAIPGLNQFV